MSDWSDGVAAQGGTAVMSKLLGASSVANPYAAAAGALAAAAGSTATSGSTGNKFQTGYDNSAWNVNFGGGSITSSATREAASQWIGIAAGIVTLLIAFRVLKG